MIPLIIIWLLPFSIVFLVSFLRVNHLKRRYIHDEILFSLCDARDRAAVLAINGSINENSAVFEYFYKTLSTIIHDHRNFPIGFSHISRALGRSAKGNKSTFVRKLTREIKAGDEAVKEMVGVYLRAAFLVIQTNRTAYFLESFMGLFTKQPTVDVFKRAEKSFTSSSLRSTARFSSSLSKASKWTQPVHSSDICCPA